MSAAAIRSAEISQPKIGDASAHQPLSGIATVTASAAVHGLGHGAFVRNEKTEKASNAK